MKWREVGQVGKCLSRAVVRPDDLKVGNFIGVETISNSLYVDHKKLLSS